MYFKQGAISTLSGRPWKLIDKFTTPISYLLKVMLTLRIGYGSYGNLIYSKNKTGFFLNSDCVNTNVWMHSMDTNKIQGKKVRLKLYNATCYFEQILEAKPYKTAVVQPLTSHLKNHPKTWTRYAGHCWRSKGELLSDFFYGPLHMNVPVLADQQELIYISADTWYSLEDLLGVMDYRDEWRESSNDAVTATW